MLDVLADGSWHELEDVLRVGMPLVPPGIAYRKGEWARLHRRGTPGERTRGDASVSVAAGARWKVRDAIWNQVYRGHVERDRDQVRITRRHR